MLALLRCERDETLRVLAVNPSYLATIRRMGYQASEKDLCGRTLPQLIEFFGLSEEQTKRMLDRYAEVVRTGRRLVYLEDTETPSGMHYGESSLTPVVDEGGRVVNILYGARDVTEQKRAELQRRQLEARLASTQKLETMGTLAGGIAHDFNNILTAVLAFTQLALEEVEETERVEDSLKEVLVAGERARDLVQQILTFSRQSPYQPEPMRLQAVVREAAAMMGATVPKNVRVEMEVLPDAPAVMADGSQMHQVVVNLCTNAVQAMAHGGGRLSLRLSATRLRASDPRLKPGMPPGPYAELVVQDTGEGIEAQYLDRIFEPFFTTKDESSGTGLGLSVVHGIVYRHGGIVQVHSERAVGTSVEVLLPACAHAPKHGSEPENIQSGKGERLLFVDDEPAICKAAAQLLASLSYEVETHTHPQSALDDFRTAPQRFDALVCDLTMPGLSGIEVAREARRLREDVPLLFISGWATNADLHELTDMGSHCVGKPLRLGEMAKGLRLILDP